MDNKLIHCVVSLLLHGQIGGPPGLHATHDEVHLGKSPCDQPLDGLMRSLVGLAHHRNGAVTLWLQLCPVRF